MAGDIQAFTSDLPEDCSREAIESEIHRLATIVIDLKSRLNRRAPISILPPEILREIFVFHVADSYQAAWHDSSGTSQPQLALTNVCRHWRLVVLTMPGIWGYITTQNLAILREFIARSKHAPLRISPAAEYPDISELRKVLSAQVSRISELRIRVSIVATVPWRPYRIFEGLAPALHTFTLLLETGGWRYGGYWSPFIAPNLRQLELENVPIHWGEWGAYPALVKLVVKQPDHNITQGTMRELVAALDKMPSLETLELSNVLLARSGEGEAIQGTGGRPDGLLTLNVGADARDCAGLLQHLSLSPNTRILLRISQSGRFVALLAALEKQLAKSLPAKFLLFHQTFARFNFSLSPRAVDTDDAHCVRQGAQDCAARISVAFDSMEYDDTSVKLITRTLLPYATSVRHVTFCAIYNAEWHLILEALAVSDPDSTPLPNLREMSFTLVNFDVKVYPRTPRAFDVFLGWLMVRCDSDVPVERVTITSCSNFGPRQCEALREIVPDVEWDGHEEMDKRRDAPSDSSEAEQEYYESEHSSTDADMEYR